MTTPPVGGSTPTSVEITDLEMVEQIVKRLALAGWFRYDGGLPYRIRQLIQDRFGQVNVDNLDGDTLAGFAMKADRFGSGGQQSGWRDGSLSAIEVLRRRLPVQDALHQAGGSDV